MYPDTTGNPFGGGTPPPPFRRAVGAAGIPAQRSPWEPPARPQNEPAPFTFGPAQPSDEADPAQPPDDPDSAQPAGESDPAQTETEPAVPVADPEETEPPMDAAAAVDAEDTDTEAEDTDAEAGAAEREAREAEREAREADEKAAEVAEQAPDETGGAVPAGPLRPGDVDETRIALWADASTDAEAFRVRIREAGNLFVDDPNFAVTAAASVVTDAVDALAAALRRQHAELDPRHRSDNPDTESLRVAVRRYREFLDRVLAL
jgi:hypothetical protein